MVNPLAADLDHILVHTHDLWEELRGQRIFITGGTGFFGCWLLESFAWANDRLGLGASALVLTRNPEAFHGKAPHLANHPAILWHRGDIRSFDFPEGKFSHIIHAAIDYQTPLLLFDTCIQGTRRTLEFAQFCGTHKFLLTSSGAVYGKQPPEITHIPDDYANAPSTMETNSAYGQGKRVSEFLCAAFAEMYGLEIKIARCFAFVGPYLPLHLGSAIGNFILDALQGETIQIKGNGTPYRSYLYAADLAIWLWKILFKGKSCHPYNVGSESDLTIAAVAHAVAESVSPGLEIHIAQQPILGQPTERYVPSTRRAQVELGLEEYITLPEAIQRTVHWYRETLNQPAKSGR